MPKMMEHSKHELSNLFPLFLMAGLVLISFTCVSTNYCWLSDVLANEKSNWHRHQAKKHKQPPCRKIRTPTSPNNSHVFHSLSAYQTFTFHWGFLSLIQFWPNYVRFFVSEFLPQLRTHVTHLVNLYISSLIKAFLRFCSFYFWPN